MLTSVLRNRFYSSLRCFMPNPIPEQLTFDKLTDAEPASALQQLVFLDTETTGTEIGKDHICQVCFLQNGELNTQFFKPPVPIPVKAMSIHHITNRMVANSPAFAGSEMQRELNARLETGILVAHNARFDIGMLRAEGVKVNRHICTYRVTFWLDRDSSIPEYNLQYLRYFLDLDVEGTAHDAEGDVRVMHALFLWLLAKMRQEKNDDAQAIEAMVEISEQPILFRKFNFGKYKDHTIADVARSDRGYIEWLLAQKQKSPSNEDDWIFTLNHYLKG